jgi:hypothetical protein
MNCTECLKEALFIALITITAAAITRLFMVCMGWKPAELNVCDSMLTTGIIISVSMFKYYKHRCIVE